MSDDEYPDDWPDDAVRFIEALKDDRDNFELKYCSLMKRNDILLHIIERLRCGVSPYYRPEDK